MNIRGGIPGHLLVGHGPEMKDLERRDINTTNNLSYNERQKASEITASLTYYTGKEKAVQKMQINVRNEDVPAVFGNLVKGDERKPRGYGEYTKKCDNNYLKLGLRK